MMSIPNKKEPRQGLSLAVVTGITGEILITVGVLIALFLLWYLVWNDAIQSRSQSESAQSLSQQWIEPTPYEPKLTNEEPPVTDSGAEGNVFALMYIPRFGADYVRSIAEGVDVETVLNSKKLGVGRYLESNQLGELGNFALAAHRNTWGASFGDIGELRLGDRIYVEVPEGWYSYQFRNLEYVWETELDVLNPFPKMSGPASSSRIITLTSCHPKFSQYERIIAYGVYEGWYPRAGGAPKEISDLAQGEN